MANNTHWSIEDMKKKGLVQNANGDFVPVKSLVAKKVDKIEPYQFLGESSKGLSTFVPRNGQLVDTYELGIPIFNTAPTGDTFLLPNGSYIDVKYRFVIDPLPAPRMTQSDKWKTDPNHPDPKKRQRKPVQDYFRFKNRLVSLCEVSGYKLTKTLNIVFVVPFPKSYNAKKRAQLNGQPHDQKPDIDNFSKCWMDSLSDNDREVWNLHAIKLWGYEGQIIIF